MKLIIIFLFAFVNYAYCQIENTANDSTNTKPKPKTNKIALGSDFLREELKNPMTGFIGSFIIRGAGQVYNEDIRLGIIFFSIPIAASLVSTIADDSESTFYTTYLVSYTICGIASAFEAAFTSRAINNRIREKYKAYQSGTLDERIFNGNLDYGLYANQNNIYGISFSYSF